jgi:D-sedoheptulose 7-phosphate isomerase
MSSKDCLFVMSVGGGDKKLRVSENLVDAIDFAVSVGANVTGIVGREGGYLKSVTGKCIVVPTVDPNGITFQVEGFQALVSHPNLKPKKAKWESMPS